MAAHSISSSVTQLWPCGGTCVALAWRRTPKIARARLWRCGGCYGNSLRNGATKGKTKPVDAFTFIGARNEDVDSQLLKWLEAYEEGLEKFRVRDFTQAKILFSRFLEFYPDDLLAQMYLARSLDYERQPPDEAWDAVEVLTKK